MFKTLTKIVAVATLTMLMGCSNIFTNNNFTPITHANLEAWCNKSPTGTQDLGCFVDNVIGQYCLGILQIPMTIPGAANQFCSVGGWPMALAPTTVPTPTPTPAK